jgi:hypothetical protein
MPLAKITPMGESGLYHIHLLDTGVDPGFGVGLPPHPGHRPPGSWPGHPDQGLPPSAGIPDHDLPINPPPVLLPGYTLVLVRGPMGKWEYAFIAPSDPPPRPLPPPGGGGHPDQGLPIQPGHPDQGLPGQRPPHVSTGPVPPPPGASQGPGFPTNPIAPGGQPPVATQPPMPGQLPGAPPQPSPTRR